MAESLKQKAASGMVWTALQKYSTMFIRFFSGIILARLLTPYDYGCIGMLSIFMVLADTFIDGGFGSALIQKKRPTQEDYSTIFWWNLGMAALMYAILFISAPVIARFYNTPILCVVLRVQGIVLFTHALNLIQQNKLKKKLNFKLLSIVSIVITVINLVITIILAYKGFGVWALVAQNLIGSALYSLIFWFYVKWRPSWIFSWKSFKELFDFGFYMFLTHLINSFSGQIQGLLIGKKYNPSTMGYYSKASGTESLASHSISSIMTQVTYPLFAEVQDDKVVLSNMIKRLSMTLSYITFPMMFILLLCAKPLFVLLYSDRWLQSIPYFQVLCFAGLAGCLQSANLQAIAAIGKSKTMFVWTLLKRGVGIGAIVLGMVFFGMKGLLGGMVLNAWFSYFVNIGLVSKHVGYKFWRQILDLLPVGIVALIAAAVSFGVGHLLHLSMYPDGLVKAGVYAVIYLGWSFIFKPEAYTYFLTIIPDRFKLFKKLKKNKKQDN
ncbi:MAG: lipopolysaccharide biosynthesis protein [Bacteroidales bacterium]|jgi:O-antigen/teichoic acid export membrane protein|nr:lipopolysaccharide biosynthesis protein [Bacteroidales bacterium]